MKIAANAIDVQINKTNTLDFAPLGVPREVIVILSPINQGNRCHENSRH